MKWWPEIPYANRRFPTSENVQRYVTPEALDITSPYGGWDADDHFLSFKTDTIKASVAGQAVKGGGRPPPWS